MARKRILIGKLDSMIFLRKTGLWWNKIATKIIAMNKKKNLMIYFM